MSAATGRRRTARPPPDGSTVGRRSSWLLAIWRASVLIAWTLTLLPPALVGKLTTGKAPSALVGLWHRGACRIIGLELSMDGRPSNAGPALFVANHISYVDILVLGSYLEARFIAKADVNHWPVFGFLAGLIGTVFVERKARESAKQRDTLAQLLASGERLVLFAEGTSSDGRAVLPFKSSLLGALEADGLKERVHIQPVTIDYAAPISEEASDDRQKPSAYAWYGDMTLMPHLWRILGKRSGRVSVRWHDAIPPDRWADRKDLARQLHAAVSDGLVGLAIKQRRHQPAPPTDHPQGAVAMGDRKGEQADAA